MIVKDLFLALILCHNVTPIIENITEMDSEDDQGDRDKGSQEGQEPGEKTRKIFNASSPDEIALVKFAESLGMTLLERDDNVIRIKDATGYQQDYDILQNFRFSS